MKKFLAFILVIVAVFTMAVPAAANTSTVLLYSVSDSWYFNSASEGVLTVKDNKVEFIIEVEKGINVLGRQRDFTGQLKFVNFVPRETVKNFRHIVIWDFKKGLSDDEKTSFFYTMKLDLENLVHVIPGIIELRVMRDIVNAGLNGEGQIVLDATFESQKAFEVYRDHPAHLEIAAFVVNNIVENRRGVNFLESDTTRHSNKFRHIVVWEFQDLNKADKDSLFNQMKEDLEALVGVINGLVELKVFRDHYNLSGNGQVALVALFNSRADWENYVPHPEHQRIAAYVVRDIVIAESRRGGNFYESGLINTTEKTP